MTGTTSSNTIEYGTQAAEQGVVVRRSANHVMVEIRPTAARLLKLAGELVGAMLVPAGLLVFMEWQAFSMGRFLWEAGILPGIVAILVIVGKVPAMVTTFFPVMFEVTPQLLVCRWRSLTEAKSQSWARESVLAVRAERTKLARRLGKRWALLLLCKDGGDKAVFCSNPGQLRVIGEALRQALGLAPHEIAAMQVPMPRGRRITRRHWRDGVIVALRPRWAWHWGAGLLVVSCGIGAGIAYFLLNVAVVGVPNMTHVVSCVFMGAAVMGILWFLPWMVIKRVQRSTVLAADSSWLQVIETSLFRPLNVQWNQSDVREVRAVAGAGGGLALEIVPVNGQPLLVLQNETPEVVRWAAEVLGLVRAEKEAN